MKTRIDDGSLAQMLAREVVPFTGAMTDYDPLLELTGDARIVLIGEASHGTHEFYRRRAELTQRLIREKGFGAVAVEADWPDAYRINRFVRGMGPDADARAALGDFKRFPAWMWRNTDVLDFVRWLRAHNDSIEVPGEKAGFYGLDLYSLHSSADAVLDYLDQVDPEAAQRARYRYGCFEHFGEDPQAYGHAISYGLSAGCEGEAVAQLLEMYRRRQAHLEQDGVVAEEEQFQAEQNARVVKNAEEYYRMMFSGRISSWNLRDTHMADTLDAVLGHLDNRFGRAKVVVWAHNSHVGDARATDMADGGELNIGQLARERHPGEVRLIGFTTHTGTVTAASTWGGPAERKNVRPSLPRSYERLFHEVGVPAFLVPLRDATPTVAALREPHLQRAIGVIYRPDTERASHYLSARLPEQLDAVIHIDETRAVEPLDRASAEERGDVPETYPTGL